MKVIFSVDKYDKKLYKVYFRAHIRNFRLSLNSDNFGGNKLTDHILNSFKQFKVFTWILSINAICILTQ